MNFKNKIKELKKHAKKINLKNITFKETLLLSIVSSIGLLFLFTSIFLTYGGITTNVHVQPIMVIMFFMVSLLYGFMAKDMINDIKAKDYIISQKVISEFIESFPTEYHEQVKYHVADKMGQKKSFSLFDLRMLEKNLKIETLKNMKESEIKIKENYQNIILEKHKEYTMQ